MNAKPFIPRQQGPVMCPRCEGSGDEPGAGLDFERDTSCRLCHGRGEVKVIVAQQYERKQERR